MTLRSVLTVLCAAFFVATVAARPAAAQQDASQFINQMAGEAIATLKETGKNDRQAREARFRTIFQQGFDVAAIGKFVLGQYWRRATEEQRKEYLKLFEDFVVRSYAERLNQYSGETLQVGRSYSEGDRIFVESQIIHTDGSPPLPIVWEVEKQSSGFRVTDVKIGGVSMGQTQRSDFGSYISQNGGNVDVLIAKLRQMTSAR